MSTAPCSQRWLVEAVRDGRVMGGERLAFEVHLTNCTECAAHSRSASALRERLAELPDGLPDTFTLRRQRRALLGELDLSLVAPAPRSRPLLLAATCTVLAAGVVGVWLLRRAPAVASWVEVVADQGAAWSEQRAGKTDRIALQNGRFRLTIRRPSPGSRVLLALPDGEIEDLGTELEILTENGRTSRVIVRSGEILMRVRGFAELHLRAGSRWDREAAVVAEAAARTEAQQDSNEQHAAPVQAATRVQRAESAAARAPAASPIEAPARRGKSGEAKTRGAALNSSATEAEDAAYLRLLALLEANRRAEATQAVKEYLANYPHGFRRLEALDLARRLERSP